jgi:hypothetical protein
LPAGTNGGGKNTVHNRSVLALLVALSFPASASAQHFDVWFAQIGTRTDSAAFDFDGGGVIPGLRVLERALIWDAPVYVGSDPGYTAGASVFPPPTTPLPANVDVVFEALRERTLGWNLLFWDGVGPVSFGPVPDGEVLVVDQNGCVTCAQTVIDGSMSDVSGFALGRTSATGTLHVHHDYFLLGDLALSDAPTPGVYLVTLRARAGTLDWTPPFFFVFGAGASAQQRSDAADWVDANLVFPACADGTDNDGDGKIDFAGGPLGEPADGGCQNQPARMTERPPQGCGLGGEAAVLLWVWRRLRKRRAIAL